MKVICNIFIIVCVVFNLSLNAQTKKNNSSQNTGNGCFNESSKILNIGIGFGSRGYYRYSRGFGYSYRSTPAFSLSYEQALKNKIGPGYLGLGAYLGYQSAYLNYDNYYYNNNKYYYRHNWRYFLIAARGAYHLDILNTNKAELYVGAILGIRFATYSYETNSLDPNKNLYQLNESSIYPSYSFFIGGRYYFTTKIAAFAEFGYGISYLTLGASFKL